MGRLLQRFTGRVVKAWAKGDRNIRKVNLPGPGERSKGCEECRRELE